MNEFTCHIPRRIQQLIASGRYAPVLFTRFINTEGSPYHTLLGWNGCAEPPETELVVELGGPASPRDVFEKHGLTGLPQALSDRLQSEGWRKISLVGIDTDMCVLKI
ncbi:MAG: isochorismatase family protein, partial [Chloroflexi bacterium]|nr:isochorismatase family protein [Chloroflexota bacterium]